MKLRALHDKVLCTEIEYGQQTSLGGIILMNDDGKEEGIRPRWMKVLAVGPEVRDITVDQWIMVEHGRWTRGMTMRDDDNEEVTVWGIEESSILLVSDEKPGIERSASTAN